MRWEVFSYHFDMSFENIKRNLTCLCGSDVQNPVMDLLFEFSEMKNMTQGQGRGQDQDQGHGGAGAGVGVTAVVGLVIVAVAAAADVVAAVVAVVEATAETDGESCEKKTKTVSMKVVIMFSLTTMFNVMLSQQSVQNVPFILGRITSSWLSDLIWVLANIGM